MSILTYIDGSRHSDGALHAAAWASQRLALPVELVYLIESTTVDPTVSLDRDSYGIMDTREDMLRDLVARDAVSDPVVTDDGRELLARAAASAREYGAVSVKSTVAHDELPDHLASHARTSELIVIGKRGQRTSTRRGKLGENTNRAVRDLHGAALIATAAWKPVQRVLVAYDGSASSGRIVDFLATSPLLRECSIEFVMVGGDPSAKRSLRDTTHRMSAMGYDVTTRIVDGDPDRVIPSIAEKEGFDLLVFGAFGHARIVSLFRGSTTAKLLRESMVPMLVVR